jgi:basic membrane lipoprotein Med (substrate-binding protein (PBP1-ABC) superfamily)
MGSIANQNQLAPEHVLASVVYDWGPIYQQMIEETVAGEFGNTFYWIEFANEGLAIAFNDDLAEEIIDEELHTMLDASIEGFIDGTLDLGDLDTYELEEMNPASG